MYSLKPTNIWEELHESIVHNHPLAGGWVERGANDAMNVRVAILYLVEFLTTRQAFAFFNFIRTSILSVFGSLLLYSLHICANSSPHGKAPWRAFIYFAAGRRAGALCEQSLPAR